MIVLDTHAWIWWLSAPAQLSDRARQAIEDAAREPAVLVSSISAWEAALLHQKGRLQFRIPFADWLARAEALPFVRYVAVDNTIAVRSVHLEGELHTDPADRLIVATAIERNARLVTRDRKLLDYPFVDTIW